MSTKKLIILLKKIMVLYLLFLESSVVEKTAALDLEGRF